MTPPLLGNRGLGEVVIDTAELNAIKCDEIELERYVPHLHLLCFASGAQIV